jgi:hypothetical protein
MKTNKITRSILFALAASLAVACSSADNGDGGGEEPTPGNAYLTIVGDSNVFLENGWTQRLQVRYHDGNDTPLAGQVDFAIVGNSNGATLVKSFGVTNADGIVEVDMKAGAEGDASFKIKATAEYADGVEWTIAVSEGTPPLPPLDPTGSYTMHSSFDMVSGLPGTVGDVVNGFIEMTDDPYDPATFVIDLVLDKIDNSTIEGLVNTARPVIDGIVNEAILNLAPDFVNNILEVGNKFGQVARNFGTVSTLKIEKTGGVEGEELVGTHTMTGMYFDIDGQRYTFSMAELGMQNLVAEQVTVRMEGETKVILGDHDFTLSYGSILMVALNQIIIPLIDPYASNLNELLSGLVNCNAVGVSISDYIGFGSPSLYEGACSIGLTAASGLIEDQIRDLDQAGMVLGVNGDAKPQDTNTDRKVDVLLGGKWFGDVTYAGNPANLGDSTFRGERQAIP